MNIFSFINVFRTMNAEHYLSGKILNHNILCGISRCSWELNLRMFGNMTVVYVNIFYACVKYLSTCELGCQN